MDSILISIKKMLGITSDYTHFDEDIMININSAFFTLNQIGVGPTNGFSIKNDEDKWGDFTTDKYVEMVKTYIYLKVKLIFDPPLTSSVLDSIEKQISELEWRLSVTYKGV